MITFSWSLHVVLLPFSIGAAVGAHVFPTRAIRVMVFPPVPTGGTKGVLEHFDLVELFSQPLSLAKLLAEVGNQLNYRQTVVRGQRLAEVMLPVINGDAGFWRGLAMLLGRF